MLVTGELIQENLLRLRGILEDHIYAMEMQMDVRLPDGVISSIQGEMKRYTNPVCPQAVGALQKAVGMSLRDPAWISRVNREIGRQGCQHFAEILVECGRCLDQARMSHHLGEALKAQPSASPREINRSWVSNHPEAQDFCLARPKG